MPWRWRVARARDELRAGKNRGKKKVALVQRAARPRARGQVPVTMPNSEVKGLAFRIRRIARRGTNAGRRFSGMDLAKKAEPDARAFGRKNSKVIVVTVKEARGWRCAKALA